MELTILQLIAGLAIYVLALGVFSLAWNSRKGTGFVNRTALIGWALLLLPIVGWAVLPSIFEGGLRLIAVGLEYLNNAAGQ